MANTFPLHSLLDPLDHELIRQLLRGSRELMATPARWTRQELARDSRGAGVKPDSPRATRFCLLGAMLRTASDPLGFDITNAPDPAALTYRLEGEPRLVQSFNLVGVLAATTYSPAPSTIRENGVELIVGNGERIVVSFTHCIAILNDAPGFRHARVIEFIDEALLLVDLLERIASRAAPGTEEAATDEAPASAESRSKRTRQKEEASNEG